ncbi:MAG: tRNA (adenosine(37)-N6)-threonylcarbamoyltransferase complex transferase subunit TsaD [Thermodesulfobacteriota bacterium]
MNILGIETSCDETAAAIVADGQTILSSIVSSQVHIHRPYGGVVPELASRKHIENIVPVVRRAMDEAGITPERIDALAATRGPGLVGALLVGFSFAKAFAYALNRPLIGVNHLDGHLGSVLISESPPDFPFVSLLASGGHTAIYEVVSATESRLMGQTRDDAAGEAFDKVAKALGLGYPGGAVIEKVAGRGNPAAVSFTRPYLDKNGFDFSFSGIKTAVSRQIQLAGDRLEETIPDIAAGFQEAVADVLCHKLIHAAEVKGSRHIALVGGVAANSRVRQKLAEAASARGLSLHVPPLELCGDNAAMIAVAGFHRLSSGLGAALDTDVFSRVSGA